MENITDEGLEEIKEQVIEVLSWYDEEGSELHHHAFNTDYFIIGYYQAEKWLKDHYGIFSAIDKIKEYEQDQFGEVTTDLSSSEKVVNMLVYIIGEEILSKSTTLQDNWDLNLNEELNKKIIEEIKEVN